jgi:hypothetical protein
MISSLPVCTLLISLSIPSLSITPARPALLISLLSALPYGYFPHFLQVTGVTSPHIQSYDFQQQCQDHSWGKGNLFNIYPSMLGRVNLHMQKNEVGILPNTRYRNFLKNLLK